MELTFTLLAATIVLILIWTVWQLQQLQKRLNVYNDYVGEVKEEIVGEVLSQEFLGQLRNHAQLQLTNTVAVMDEELKRALQESYQQLMQGIEREAAGIINGELEQYRKTIAEAVAAAANVSSDTERQLVEIHSRVEEETRSEVREEKKRLIAQLDTKLGDIIVNYLLEALGEGVDLGSQKQYILDSLEQHKDSIKKDVNDEF